MGVIENAEKWSKRLSCEFVDNFDIYHLFSQALSTRNVMTFKARVSHHRHTAEARGLQRFARGENSVGYP